MTLVDLLKPYNEIHAQASTPAYNITTYMPDKTNQSKKSQANTVDASWYFGSYAGNEKLPGLITPDQQPTLYTQGEAIDQVMQQGKFAPKQKIYTDSKALEPKYKTQLSDSMKKRAAYWMDKFAKFTPDVGQQIALVAAMMGECGLVPKGSVEKKELAGLGNTKAGWAGAGEGAVGFTHWDLKRKLIEKYNKDPRKVGPELTTDEKTYNKSTTRHIADLDDDDHALMVYLYYKDLINDSNKTNESFSDLVARFYQNKAGVNFYKNIKNPYERALATGKYYQKVHREKYKYYKAAKYNTFLQTLGRAYALADHLGFKYA